MQTRRSGSVARAARRLAVRPASASNAPLPERAAHWLYPWVVWEYPGRRRGPLSVLGDSVTPRAVEYWRKGEKPLAPWAARAWAAEIKRLSEEGLQIAADLERYAVDQDERVALRQTALSLWLAAGHRPGRRAAPSGDV